MINRRKFLTQASAVVGVAAVSPQELLSPVEQSEFTRLAVEVFEGSAQTGKWLRVTGMEVVKIGQIFRFLMPDTLEPVSINVTEEGNLLENQMIGVAIEDGKLVQSEYSGVCGKAECDVFSSLDEALQFTGR